MTRKLSASFAAMCAALMYLGASTALAQQAVSNAVSSTVDSKQSREERVRFYTLLAQEALKQKQFEQAAAAYVKAFGEDARNSDSAYNAACAYAQYGATEQAFLWLDKSLKAGFTDAGHVAEDTDLISLHQDARWQPLLEKMKLEFKRQQRLWNSEVWNTPYHEQLSEDERVAGLSKFWSEVKYNFVYTDTLLDLDWDAVYLQYLPKVRAAKDTKEYYLTLMEMCALLKDAHTSVTPPEALFPTAFAVPPFRTRLIEGRVIVTDIADEKLRAQGVLPGTEILQVNGQDVKAYAQKTTAHLVSASTPQDMENRIFNFQFLMGDVAESPELRLRDAAGKSFSVRVQRGTYAQRNQSSPFESYSWRMLPGNVAYVELNSFGSDVAAKSYIHDFPEIARAKAIIFDIRKNGGGSTNVGYRILSTLTPQPFIGSHSETRNYQPAVRAWGAVQLNHEFRMNPNPADKEHQFGGKVIVLTSAGTFSAAEDFAVAFDTMKRGRIIGEPTGGSTGQPLSFSLPGGGSARVCTKKDTYADGKLFVGVGVQPDRLVRPTLNDFRAGRDTVLEAALAELQ